MRLVREFWFFFRRLFNMGLNRTRNSAFLWLYNLISQFTQSNYLNLSDIPPKFLEINETCIDYIKFTFESQKYNLFLSDKNNAPVYVYANLTDLNKNNNYFLDVELKVYNDKNDEILNTNISDFIKRCFIKESYLPWIKSKYEFWTELLYENSIISKSVYKSILNNLETYRLVLKTVNRNIEILENDNIIFYTKNDTKFKLMYYKYKWMHYKYKWMHYKLYVIIIKNKQYNYVI